MPRGIESKPSSEESPLPNWIERVKNSQPKQENRRVPPPPRPVPKTGESRQEKENQIKELKEEMENRELAELAQEFKKGLELGSVAYGIQTKIPNGQSFRGITENKTGVELYRSYQVKKPDGPSVPASVKGSPRQRAQFGDVVVQLDTDPKYQEVTRKFTEEESTWHGLWKKKVEKTKKVRQDTGEPMTLADYGVKTTSNEPVSTLLIDYPTDTTQFTETREIRTIINCALPQKLAKELSNSFTKNPEALWEFIREVDPKLIELAPPSTNTGRPETANKMAFYDFSERRKDRDVMKAKPDKVVSFNK